MRTSWACRLAASALVLAVVDAASRAQTNVQAHIPGPSFSCPKPRDALAQLVCDTPALARFDLWFAETYQALRQQLDTPQQQTALRQEAVDFDRGVREACGVPPPQPASGPPPPLVPPWASGCVLQAYQRQQTLWSMRLTGIAAEEAAMPIEARAQLQSALQQMDLLTTTDPLTGVFGPLTRAAISQWQASSGRPVTGLLGNTDARDLPRAASDLLIAKQIQIQQQMERRLAEQTAERRRTLIAKYGDHADAILAGIAQIGMLPEEVIAAKGDPRDKLTIPPGYEIWVYDNTRVSFTDGKVTHVGQ
jgi:hypothetical protein